MNTIRIFTLLFLFLFPDIIFAQSPVPTEVGGAMSNGADSNASFGIGLSTDNGATYINTVSASTSVKIMGYIRPEPQQVGQTADIFFVARLNGSVFYMRNSLGQFIPWNGSIPALVPYMEDVTLTENLAVNLYTGPIGIPGNHQIFLGYLPADGILRYTPLPVSAAISAPIPNPGNGDSDPGSGDPQTLTGTWSVSETVNATGCGEGIYTENYSASVVQTGDQVSVSASGITRSGTLSNNTLNFSVSYPEEGGVNTTAGSITFDTYAFSGSSSWSWTGDGITCSGSSTIEGDRITDSGPDSGSGSGSDSGSGSGATGELATITLEPGHGSIMDDRYFEVRITDPNPEVARWQVWSGDNLIDTLPYIGCLSREGNTCSWLGWVRGGWSGNGGINPGNPEDWGKQLTLKFIGLNSAGDPVSSSLIDAVYTIAPAYYEFTLEGEPTVAFTWPVNASPPAIEWLNVSITGGITPGTIYDVVCPGDSGPNTGSVTLTMPDHREYSSHSGFPLDTDCSGSITIGAQPATYTNGYIWTLFFSAQVKRVENGEIVETRQVSGEQRFRTETLYGFD